MKVGTTLLIVASSALVSCECAFVDCCPGDYLPVQLWVHDSQGRSMLDPDTPGYFYLDSVKLFSLIDGELKPQTTRDQYRHYPRKLDTARIDGKLQTHLAPFLDQQYTTENPTTVIMWLASDSDTVDFEVVTKCDILRTKTVWYNGDMTHELFVDVAK